MGKRQSHWVQTYSSGKVACDGDQDVARGDLKAEDGHRQQGGHFACLTTMKPNWHDYLTERKTPENKTLKGLNCQIAKTSTLV